MGKQHCSPPTISDAGKFVAVDENGSFTLTEGSGGHLYAHYIEIYNTNNIYALCETARTIIDDNSEAYTKASFRTYVQNKFAHIHKNLIANGWYMPVNESARIFVFGITWDGSSDIAFRTTDGSTKNLGAWVILDTVTQIL